MKISQFTSFAVCLVGFGVALAATPFAVGAAPVGVIRTDVRITTKDNVPETASAAERAGIGSVPLTPGSLATAHAVEVHPYMPRLDTRDTHTQQVWSHR
jgi:hypothetical protein